MIEASKADGKKKILKYGMVGGGPESFIGVVHRAAIGLNGEGVLVAGSFSRSVDKNVQAGEAMGLEPDRVYKDFEEMAEKEGAREDKIDFVVITTPNMSHYPAAKAFLEKGIHVFCEKPLTVTLEDALSLKKLAQEKGCLFGVGYTYTGHVMAMEARELIKNGVIGDIITVVGEYPQEWLIESAENAGSRQAIWRTDPAQAGASNCIGDIGTHIESLVYFMTGLKIKKLCANLENIGEGRTLDTNSSVLIKYDNGASGNYWCSQVAVGYDNGLKVRIFGTKGAVEFDQERSNYLKVTLKGQPWQTYSRGSGYIAPAAASYSRLPSGHPEGYHDAFANIYKSYMAAVRDKLEGKAVNEADYDYPKIDMGVDGVRFITKCVESASKGAVWVDFE